MSAASVAQSWRPPRLWWVAPILLALAIWYVNPAVLWTTLRRANPWLVALALAVSVAANVLSATRWALIARGLGLVAPSLRLVFMYARGITTNTLLPGATLPGDVLRSVQLSRLGNPLALSALSVFLDRFSGLWVLCVLSMIAAAGVALGAIGNSGSQVPPEQLRAYLLVLAGITAVPFLPSSFGKLDHSSVDWVARLASRWERLRVLLRQARPALLASVWQSMIVQCLSAATLWLCGLAIGVSIPYPVMLAAAAPIFISASLPIGMGGFGTREVAAIVVLGLAGLPPDLALAIALLFGLATALQGVLAAPLFFIQR